MCKAALGLDPMGHCTLYINTIEIVHRYNPIGSTENLEIRIISRSVEQSHGYHKLRRSQRLIASDVDIGQTDHEQIHSRISNR